MVEQCEEGILVAIEFFCRRVVERKHAGKPEMDLGPVQSRTGLGFLEGCGGTDFGGITFTGNVRLNGSECLVPPGRSGQGKILALDGTISEYTKGVGAWKAEGRLFALRTSSGHGNCAWKFMIPQAVGTHKGKPGGCAACSTWSSQRRISQVICSNNRGISERNSMEERGCLRWFKVWFKCCLLNVRARVSSLLLGNAWIKESEASSKGRISKWQDN